MIKKRKNKPAPTEAQKERGKGLLFSLKILTNVLFALLIFQIFLILPRPDDPELEYQSLKQIFSGSTDKLMVMFIGLALIVTYWIQINNQLGNLVRSSVFHASVGVFQMFSLMLYIYFVRFDMEFEGLDLALQMQSIFLAMAGYAGVYNWVYARRHKLTSDYINDQEEKHMLFSLLPEPTAALFSLPFATIGPEEWTLSFLIILPLTYIFGKLGKRK